MAGYLILKANRCLRMLHRSKAADEILRIARRGAVEIEKELYGKEHGINRYHERIKCDIKYSLYHFSTMGKAQN